MKTTPVTANAHQLTRLEFVNCYLVREPDGLSLIGKGRLSISGFAPWFFPLPNFGTWDKAIALASAQKLLAYPIERFACGHGAVQPGGRSTLTTAIAQATSQVN